MSYDERQIRYVLNKIFEDQFHRSFDDKLFDIGLDELRP
ncbi:hypothetical protein SAMN04515679_4484 [Pelosinus fermentans]|nr:hypothetical protein FR7_04312 [Pelosinus fermentans DSM 17108]SDR38481.1 hypothetical protein SAMN04515679_4484 [Pelosinus fermentans]